MIDLSTLSLRQLQTESARALCVLNSSNDNIVKFNKKAHHNSQDWYKAAIMAYVELYGDLPSQVGPGQHIKLILDV